MSSPATRLFTVLELLQSRDELSGTALALRLEVDGRTLRRYISKLQALGIPIASDRGRYGAYRLTPGSKLPPMMFTDDEAVALSLGLLFARRFPVAASGAGAQSAQVKLERVLPATLRAKLRALSSTVQLDVQSAGASVPHEALLTLSGAAHARQRVRMRYGSAKEEHSDREFDCYGLAWRNGKWYALGYCHLRAGLRSFRLDRVKSAVALSATFTPPQNFDAARQLALGLASLPRAHAVTVRLKTDLANARAAFFDEIGLFQPVGVDVLLHSQVDDLDWYARQLARLPFDFAVVEPAPLRLALRDLASRLRRLAGRA
ncbi:MAG: YafY family transcriptional regulator [Rhodoferax sp.]|nr:YafY family transcriptional regulator [Rhodoferax sp.]